LTAIIFVLELLPLKLFNNNFSLIHIILFSAGLLYGSGFAVWGCVFGIAAAAGIHSLLNKRYFPVSQNNISYLSGSIFDFGINSFTLVLTLSLFGIASGVSSTILDSSQSRLLVLGAGIFFGIFHGGLYVITSRRLDNSQLSWINWDSLALVSIEVLPVFFGFLSLLVSPLIGVGTLLIFGVVVFALGLLIFYLSAPRKNLERRLQELSALEEISRILSSDIDLEKLLNSIHIQVTNLLNVDNFYVALLDPIDQQIWYPLAVKHGLRQTWQRRPLTERLTDRVILEGKPILIPSEARQQLSKIGLPVGEDAPYAWIGVPLITSERTIGCLALFSMSPETEFSQEDLNLLSILSGQTSVAIEIALHNALLSSDLTIGRDRLTTILNSVNEGLILFDADGKITLVNEAVSKLSGIPQSEYIGQYFINLPNPILEAIGFSIDDQDLSFGKVMQDEILITEKFTFKMKNRSPEVFIERTFIRVSDHPGNFVGLIVNLRDITDEYQLNQTQNLISETLVHDLRSPLSSTISALDVISDAQASGDPAGILEPSIQIAQRSSKRMLSMVESILEINRMESGKLDLSLSKFNIEDLIKESIAEFQITAKEYKVELTFESKHEIPKVKLDEIKIQRVINNLIDNALKFNPEGEEIALFVESAGQDRIEIHVLDRGPGIPEEYIDSIFDRFFQVPNSSSRKRGTGLGLTYCRLTAEAHNGRIWVDNRPGGGSEFVVSLPISVQEDGDGF
jgi:PAS domain S-box-containing protein